MDAKDPLARGPGRSSSSTRDLSRNNPNNPTHTAGTTFFGQFIDHDVTFDLALAAGHADATGRFANTRTPALDLDSVYGGGPVAQPAAVRSTQHARAARRHQAAGRAWRPVRGSAARPANGTAIIARSPQRRAHHHRRPARRVPAVPQRCRRPRRAPATDARAPTKSFRARAAAHAPGTTSGSIVHEFLPQIIGQPLVDDILSRGRRFYRPVPRFMPVEFQGAVYRFGHTMVRPSYRANLAGDNGAAVLRASSSIRPAKASPIRPICAAARGPRAASSAGRRSSTSATARCKPNKRLDTKLSTPLFQLPRSAHRRRETDRARSPQRNLLRHVTWQLPSGQSIARPCARRCCRAGTCAMSARSVQNLGRSTPLWFYILREAQ